ncbi:ankyrin repeat domain-containing protein [Legionella fairfieldensis]|uniref:ankyrin repeat domain-containing protein n=1 Tax=Legionella fairfieldensis TaxID=45064 RepID=UPI00048AFDA3|nr:ankyrin repeat domain-containing protein [Legionella fairfieldensis]
MHYSTFLFNNVPIEWLSSYLCPEQIATIRQVNKYFARLTKNQWLWKEKYNIHFSHQIILSNPLETINWYKEFYKTYNKEYKGFSSQEKKLFSLVKEGKIEELKPVLQPNHIQLKDNNGNDLAYWASKKCHDSILHHIDQLKNSSQEINEKVGGLVSSLSWEPFFWLFICQQPDETIKSVCLRECQTNRSALLFLAVIFNQIDRVALLLKNGANTMDLPTLLIVAVSNSSSPDLIRLLLEHGADCFIHCSNSWNSATPLSIAADRGDIETTCVLLDYYRYAPSYGEFKCGRLTREQVIIMNIHKAYRQTKLCDLAFAILTMKRKNINPLISSQFETIYRILKREITEAMGDKGKRFKETAYPMILDHYITLANKINAGKISDSQSTDFPKLAKYPPVNVGLKTAIYGMFGAVIEIGSNYLFDNDSSQVSVLSEQNLIKKSAAFGAGILIGAGIGLFSTRKQRTIENSINRINHQSL